MDKHAIFHELTKRNALRKAAQLPLLDLHKEFAYAVRREEVRDYYEYRKDRHGDEEERILRAVLEEYRERHGPHSPCNSFGWMGIRAETERRFRSFLELRGIHRPYDLNEPRGVYGADKKT